MNIGDVNTGVTYYFPVTVKEKKEDKFSSCIVDTDGGEWDEFDVGQLVTKGEIISGVTDERLKAADDQVDFWKRDSESAHEEIRKLQEQVKRLTDSNDQYKEQVMIYDAVAKAAEDNLSAKNLSLIKSERRCADLQMQLANFKSAKERDEAMLTNLNKKLNDRIAELEAEKNRPICARADEESPKVKALSKALREQGQVIRQKNATINALAERVVYLEGEMKKNGY